MMLRDTAISDFCELLSSGTPAPGGGSTAALEGALGAALIGMVATLTVGRKKYAEHEPLMIECMHQAEELQLQLLDIIDRDTEAYNSVTAVFSMPKESDDDKAARNVAMHSALIACTLTPFEMMQCALEALELIDNMLGRFNENAVSDLGVAALSLKAATQGAWLNVLINLGGIKDEAFVAECRRKCEAILQKALPLADRIYCGILQDLQ